VPPVEVRVQFGEDAEELLVRVTREHREQVEVAAVHVEVACHERPVQVQAEKVVRQRAAPRLAEVGENRVGWDHRVILHGGSPRGHR